MDTHWYVAKYIANHPIAFGTHMLCHINGLTVVVEILTTCSKQTVILNKLPPTLDKTHLKISHTFQ